jgi:hypothetical protein
MTQALLNRRSFLLSGASVIAGADLPDVPTQRFTCDEAGLSKTYEAALAGLRSNTQTVSGFPRPVLWEGGNYGGVWLECAPLEGLVYSRIDPAAALANHEVFFDLQREDGYLPCWVRQKSIGSAQIQMVVPIAATAWELYQENRNAAFLSKAYSACTRWDQWLVKYRNTRQTGLCEAFCEYDTGHDNSPRWKGKPKACPQGDARICPQVDGLPYLAPDLSVTVYGGRMALAAMAGELGRTSEQSRWLENAESIRKTLMSRLYDETDGAFYDLDATNRFVRIRGDLITRVLSEHVPDVKTFENIYRRQIHNPKAFWTPYPLPSIALDDPAFVRPVPRNSWGGAAQALTALRAPRWMEHYGKFADLAHLMTRWLEAIVRAETFLQQIDPETGDSTADRGGYSPSMLVLFDFVWRLYGVRRDGASLEWNCRLPRGASRITATIAVPGGEAELRSTTTGTTVLLRGEKRLEAVGEVRLRTRLDGSPEALVGTSSGTVPVTLQRPGGRKSTHVVGPGQIVRL